MTRVTPAPIDVPAAGVLPWRRREGRLEVALVHRARYDDWSWAKGKVDEGESAPAAAAREAYEETGLRVRLGVPLPTAEFAMTPRTGAPQRKVVRYWSARPVSGPGRLRHEVDGVRWCVPKRARQLLTYSRDLVQLEALLTAEDAGDLLAWPLVLVRHAHAVPRKSWRARDWRRPLDARGAGQAQDLAPTLAAYGIGEVVSSTATRCVHTVAPYARSAALKVRPTPWLSEEGFEDKPGRARAILTKLIKEGDPTLLCSHGPVMPALIDDLLDRTPKGAARTVLKEASADKMDKGEALVLHVRGRGKSARVVAAERHLPLR